MPLLNKIVVCDDEDSIAHLVTMALGDAGYLCLRARDGEQALFLASIERPDLMILDVMMPKLDGMETCKRLRADPALHRTPVLMLTSLASVQDRVRGLNSGADDYLPKPFDLRELVARVGALLRASRRAQDISPSTGLPTAAALEDAARNHLEVGNPFTLIHAALEGHDPFVAAHGWRRGEELVGAVGRAIAETTQRTGAGTTPSPLVVHLGGDDFGLLVACELAGALTDALEAVVAEATRAFGEPRVQLQSAVVESSAATTVEGLSKALAAARHGWRRPDRGTPV